MKRGSVKTCRLAVFTRDYFTLFASSFESVTRPFIAHTSLTVKKDYKNEKLRLWIRKQREINRNGTMSSDRRKLLDDIGFFTNTTRIKLVIGTKLTW